MEVLPTMTVICPPEPSSASPQRFYWIHFRCTSRRQVAGEQGDAKKRLEGLKAPVPEPTAEALAQSKAEESSRDKVKLVAKLTGNFKKHPNVASSTKVGEPNLQEETVTSAPAIINDLTQQVSGTAPSNSVGVQAVGTGTGTPGANEKAPGTADTTPEEGTAPKTAPPQVNEIQKADPSQPGSQTSAENGQAATTDKKTAADPKQESSSKKKEKKGLRKLIPF